MELSEGSVYCEFHGAVHDRTTDPYDYCEPIGERECGVSDWRKLWIGAHDDRDCTEVDFHANRR
jgi:hypothetical protein